MPTDQDSSVDSIAELRQLLFKPEELAHQLKPYVDQILAQQVESTRHEITNTIAPVLGEAIRQVERKTEAQTGHTEQLTQSLVAQAMKRVEEVAQSQEHITQDVGQLLARIREAELSREQMAQQLTTTLNEVKALADSQHEANQSMGTAVMPVPPPQTVISPEEQRREVIEAIYTEISHMVDESVSRATNRLEQSMREENLATKKAEEKPSWWLKLFVLLVAFLIFLLSLALCVAATYFVEEMNGLRDQVDQISATRRRATQNAVAFARQDESDTEPVVATQATQPDSESTLSTSTLPSSVEPVATAQAVTVPEREIRSADQQPVSIAESPSATVEDIVRLTQTPLPRLTSIVTVTPPPSAESIVTRPPPATESVTAASLIATTRSKPTITLAAATQQSVATEQNRPLSITNQPDELPGSNEPNQPNNGDGESQRLAEATAPMTTRPAHDDFAPVLSITTVAQSGATRTSDDFGPSASRKPTSTATADRLNRTETSVFPLSTLPPLSVSAVLTATPSSVAGSVNNQPRPTRLMAVQSISNASALSLTMSADKLSRRSLSMSATLLLTATAISHQNNRLLITVTPVPIITVPPSRTGTAIADTLLFVSPNGRKTTVIIPTDTTVAVLAQYGDWYHVSVTNIPSSVSDFVGWAPTECIKLTIPLPDTLITPRAE